MNSTLCPGASTQSLGRFVETVDPNSCPLGRKLLPRITTADSENNGAMVSSDNGCSLHVNHTTADNTCLCRLRLRLLQTKTLDLSHWGKPQLNDKLVNSHLLQLSLSKILADA